MKPKQLKCPFTWEERRPLIEDQVLYVPNYYQKHSEWSFPGWASEFVFGNEAPVFIEYCAGNGAWIEEKARTNPHYNWVAVEKRFDRARKIWSKAKNLQLKNLFVVCGEALTFSRYYLQSDSVDGVYVNFPDPWPKERHAKNRLIEGQFVQELSRVVKKGGSAVLVTDDLPYCEQMVEEMRGLPSWHSSYESPYYATSWPHYGTSYFDQLWREQGREIYYLQFINQKP